MPRRIARKSASTFPVTNSILSANAIVTDILVPCYGLSPKTTCRFHNFGLNDTFMVEAPEAKYVFRVYRPDWRSTADIGYELDALEHLASKGVSVSTVVPRLDSKRITTVVTPEGKRPAAMFTFAPGRELEVDETDSADFGRSCALMHTATDGFVSRHRRLKLDLNHLLDQPLASVRPHLAHRSKDWEFIRELAGRLRQRIHAIEPSSLDMGFCHGDFHGGNVHREGDQLTHFDFDCCGYGWRAYDVAVYRWAGRYTEREAEANRWNAYLKAYREVRKLS